MRQGLLLVAVVAGGWLMSSYVQVLHDSVERGDRFRAEQRALSQAAPAPRS